MRITTNMLAQSAAKNGMQFQRTTLLDILNDSSSGNILNGLNQTSNATNVLKKNNYTKLETATDLLNKSATNLLNADKTSLFGKAEENKDTKDIVKAVEKTVEEFNDTLKQLKSTGDTLSTFYKQQLVALPGESKEILAQVGITQDKDGNLVVDEKALEAADFDTLKKAFGSDSTFTQKLAYISGRVNDNAAANLNSLSSQYGANGLSYSNSFDSNKYNFWG